MTQPNDPWAAASAAPAGVATYSGTNAVPAQPAADNSIAGGFGAAAGGSLLFGQGPSAPILMNKTHPLGTERSGIIRKMSDVQDKDYNSKLPKFFSRSKVGGKGVCTDAIDASTGQPNDPVMVTHIELDTDYRITEAECIATSRDTSYIATDDGKRIEVVGGFDFKPFREAMEAARAAGINLASPADLIGKRLTVKRAGQKPNPGGNPSWIKTYRIDNA